MANLIIADGQYETISVNTTVTAVTGKQYYYKNTSAGNIDVTYGLTTVTMAPDTILILLYDGTDWSDLTPRLVGGDATVGNLTVTGLTTVSSSGITSSSSSINLLKPTLLEAGAIGSGNDLLSLRDSTGTDRSGASMLDLYDDNGSSAGEASISFRNFDTTANNRFFIGLNQDANLGIAYGSVFNGASTRFKIFSSSGNVGIGSNPSDTGTGILQVGAGSNITAEIGKSVHQSVANTYRIHHSDLFVSNPNAYMLQGLSNGITLLNAASDQYLEIRNNNLSLATFSGSQIDFKKRLNGKRLMSSGTGIEPTSGVYLQTFYDTGNDWGTILTYDYDTSAHKRLRLEASAILLNPNTGNNVIVGSTTDNGSDLLQVGSNTDISASIGRTKLHSSFSDFAMFSHIDYADQTNYALAHRNNGSTILNCVTGGSVAIWNGGSTGQVAYFSQTEIEFRKNLNGKRIMSSGFDVAPSTGAYIQAYYDPGVGNEWGTILSYDYDAAEYKRVRLEGSNILLNATTGNNVIVGSTIDNGSDLLQVGSNTNISVSLGRGKLGTIVGTSDRLYISHYNFFNGNDYALAQFSGGTTSLNAPTGQIVGIRNNHAEVATFSGSQIDFKKPLQIENGVEGNSLFSVSAIGAGSIILKPGGATLPNVLRFGGAGDGAGSFQIVGTGDDIKATFSGSQIDLLKDTVITGNLSKTSGSFRIPHPLKETHDLVHSFVEAPTADNIYSGMVLLVDGKAEINLDQASGMTEGTFLELNTTLRRHTSNESGFTKVISRIEGNILIIEAEDNNCTDEIYWQVIGERQDKQIKESCLTDENGKVIVEPLKKETK